MLFDSLGNSRSCQLLVCCGTLSRIWLMMGRKSGRLRQSNDIHVSILVTNEPIEEYGEA